MRFLAAALLVMAAASAAAAQPGVEALTELQSARARDIVLVPVDKAAADLVREAGRRRRGEGQALDLRAPSDPAGAILEARAVEGGPLAAFQAYTRQELSAAAQPLRKMMESRAGRSSVLDLARTRLWERASALEARAAPGGNLAGWVEGAAATASLAPAEKAAADLDILAGKGVPVAAQQLLLMPKPAEVARAAQTGRVQQTLTAPYNSLVEALLALMANPDDPQTVASFKQWANLSREAFVKSWPEIRKHPEMRRLAVSIFDGLEQLTVLKAVYGAKSKFPPASYETMYQRAQRVVGVDYGGQQICSGLALTSEWILTAGHCFIQRDPTSALVVFPSQGGAQLTVLGAWPANVPGDAGDEAIDYAFVRVAKASAAQDARRRLDAEAADALRPVCWRRAEAQQNQPLVVIGREGETLVYDGATVLYPYRPGPSEFADVSAMTGIRLTKAGIRFHPGDVAAQDAFFDTEWADFSSAYVARDGGTYEYVGRIDEFTQPRPMLGFDTDTVHGNSGGPVFTRKEGCLLGVFTGGEADGLRLGQANWRQHEFATPMSQVVQHLQAAEAAAPDADKPPLTELLQLLNGLPHG